MKKSPPLFITFVILNQSRSFQPSRIILLSLTRKMSFNEPKTRGKLAFNHSVASFLSVSPVPSLSPYLFLQKFQPLPFITHLATYTHVEAAAAAAVDQQYPHYTRHSNIITSLF